MPLKAGQEEFAIYYDKDLGPAFGKDLYFEAKPNSCKCSVDLDNSYQCPPDEESQTFLTGDDEFDVDEMEVFGFGGNEKVENPGWLLLNRAFSLLKS